MPWTKYGGWGDQQEFWMDENGNVSATDPGAQQPLTTFNEGQVETTAAGQQAAQSELEQQHIAIKTLIDNTPGGWEAKRDAVYQQFGDIGLLRMAQNPTWVPDQAAQQWLGQWAAGYQDQTDRDFSDQLPAPLEAVLASAGFGVGGLTGAMGASGTIENSGDLQDALLADAAGLAAAPALAATLPAVGLSTVAPAAAPAATTTAAAGAVLSPAEAAAMEAAYYGSGGLAAEVAAPTLIADAAGVSGTMTDVAPGLLEGGAATTTASPTAALTAEEVAAAAGGFDGVAAAEVPSAVAGATTAAGTAGGITAAEGATVAGGAATAADATGGFDSGDGMPEYTSPTPAGASTALSRILDGTATAADWASIAGNIGAAGLGYMGSSELADAYRDISNQVRNDRMPFLNASTDWLANPDSYLRGPAGTAAVDATLRGLSVEGNPINNTTSLGIATEAGQRSWLDAVTRMGTLGTGGQDTQARLAGQGAAADAGRYGAIGGALANITNPPTTLDDLFRQFGGRRTAASFA